ncbi:polyprenyl synthetase family protein [Bailinhaonella thermotolerans]|uniref:Polyprenyl synthetase family protein n=1 Tax=Bailinhaonella thermotolerans TaxID=1070861 RepID=A0A3A4ANY1_9ACTN|nr:polyprenyl synthetase family protein [Bailinhaonella thermotolerans]RJL31376.1 polyprenyl synthetase family protein [Bailinhaonella thermotolerans]
MTGTGPLRDVRAEVDAALRAFMDLQLEAMGPGMDGWPDLAPMHAAAVDLLAEGKRLRPAFCYWGWRAAGGDRRPEIFAAAASLELLQGSALVHDDVMDGSDTRRGMPSAHRKFEALHRAAGWQGSPGRFGEGAAILLGDLFLVWSDQLFQGSGLPGEVLAAARPVFDRMRTELMCGQYLDLLEQAKGEAGTVESAYRVAVHKSARYSVERPLHIGLMLATAALGHKPEDWIDELCAAYGTNVGVAFQLRDDILGVFGDPAETGKPAGDDLREGKRTILIARALEAATPAQAATVRALLGDPALDVAGVETLREIIVETGALDAGERMIAGYLETALDGLAAAPITAEAREALHALAVAATSRRT